VNYGSWNREWFKHRHSFELLDRISNRLQRLPPSFIGRRRSFHVFKNLLIPLSNIHASTFSFETWKYKLTSALIISTCFGARYLIQFYATNIRTYSFILGNFWWLQLTKWPTIIERIGSAPLMSYKNPSSDTTLSWFNGNHILVTYCNIILPSRSWSSKRLATQIL
jgi:hypothetical protein